MDNIYNKDTLVNDIAEMKNGQCEEMILITYYSLISYIKSLFVFGASSSVTRDNLNVIKEMFRVVKVERKLLDFMLKHIDEIDIDAASSLIGQFDCVNDKTVMYYYDVINEIEDACEMNDERRGLRPRQDFLSITQDYSYAKEVFALAESKDSIKKFLMFDDDFMLFVSSREQDSFDNEGSLNLIRDDNGAIVDFRLTLPKVVDLESAILCINLYRRAFNSYSAIINPSHKEFDGDFKWTQTKYEEHLLRKAMKVVK